MLENHQSSTLKFGKGRIYAHFAAILIIRDGLAGIAVEPDGEPESECAHAHPKLKLRRQTEVKVALMHVKQSERNVSKISSYYKARKKLHLGLLQSA